LASDQEDWEEAAPRAGALVESLRSFGYSPETAVADLIDNSVSAGATRIDLSFSWDKDDSYVAVIDNGRGMDERTLFDAMRLGSLSPLVSRGPKDLGRFGLGMKTASFSQCRELTVISKSLEGKLNGRRWDLDLVGRTGQWRLLHSPPTATLPFLDVVGKNGGTAVVWTKCDRLVGQIGPDPEKAADRFYRVAERVRLHLGAIFHRYLGKSAALSITLNGSAVVPWDPILKHSATYQLPREELPFRGSTIKVTPYVLPHRSKLNTLQQDLGAGLKGWNAQQGFYIYRNDRLVVSGDWLGLGFAKDEHTKLARILIDFHSALDMDWQIDVKKSTARPPGTIVADLKRIATATRRQAEEVYRHRGNIVRGPEKDSSLIQGWEEFEERSGSHRLRVNRSHPVISEALRGPTSQKKAVERVLRFVEETVPTTLIGIRLAEALDRQIVPFEQDPDGLASLLNYSLEALTTAGMSQPEALERLCLVEPFTHYPGILKGYSKELLH
jgi:hypothetical protein